MRTSDALELLDRDAPIFTISTAAMLAGMHAQTLRTYDRLGLVVPRRARGRGRRYSPRDVTRLRLVQYLSQEEGINLNGVRRILELESQLEEAREQAAELAGDLRLLRAAAGGSRVFTADPSGRVHLGAYFQRSQRAIGR